ncbi:MAG: DNA polymerase IV [Micropepsaceae bacterium]
MSALCRDCFQRFDELTVRRCPHCRSPRITTHPELFDLSIAHIDCDAFYASIEKRDNPAIADKPVIIGGGKRGVVSTCCYIARTFGVKSAMPMFKALSACPHAVVVRPDMQKYIGVSREVKLLMLEITPQVEPLSLDEAFLDLSGTERLHKASPAQTLARLARLVEDRLGITVSVGLSFNKFLAKIASDLDKPRGMKVIGRTEALSFLESKPVTLIPGVGKAFAASLARDGLYSIGDVRRRNPKDLAAKFGNGGFWIWSLANAQDTRKIEPRSPAKGISAETTLETDTGDILELSNILWRLCEKVSARAKAAEQGGRVVQMKLKTPSFKIITRRQTLERPTQLAHRIFEVGSRLLADEAKGQRYRLVGIGLSDIVAESQCDEMDLIDTSGKRKDAAEQAMDKVRAKFGSAAIRKGRSL